MPRQRAGARLTSRDQSAGRDHLGAHSNDRPYARLPNKRWRSEARPRILHAAAAAAEPLKWSPALIDTLLDELYASDELETLIGPVDRLRVIQYPQAVALALILRHSWQPSDLAEILKRLKIRIPRR